MRNNHFPDSDNYSGLHFFNESTSVIPVHNGHAEKIITLIEENEKCHFNFVEVVFVDKTKIKEVNQEFLQRSYVTDVISFPYNEGDSLQQVEGTLYCCTPRIYEQAKEYNQPSEREFKRIIIHGLLHLIGYNDLSDQTKQEMREKEDFYLHKLG